jgi:hypothetical protein
VALPEGEEALLDRELEELMEVAGSDADLAPIPFTASVVAEEVIVHQTEIMQMVKEREEWEEKEVNFLKQLLAPEILKARRAAVDRCLTGKHDFEGNMPRSVEKNYQNIGHLWETNLPNPARNLRDYSSHVSGWHLSDEETGAMRRNLATDSIDSALDSLQASTISSGDDKSRADDHQARCDE